MSAAHFATYGVDDLLRAWAYAVNEHKCADRIDNANRRTLELANAKNAVGRIVNELKRRCGEPRNLGV